MYILTRYVVWEVLKFFLAALIGLTLCVTLGMALKEGISKGLPAVVIFRMMPYMLPEMFGITIPVAMLYSVCSVFGRMTGTNEVIALKSLGISPMAIVWPVAIFAAFLSLGTVWMYEMAATWCKPSLQRVLVESVEEIALNMLKSNRSFDCDQFSIAVKRVDPPLKSGGRDRLIRPRVTIKGPSSVTLSAAEAELSTDWKTRSLVILCNDGVFNIHGQLQASLGEESISIPIPPVGRPRYHRDWIAMSEIPDLISELQTTIRRLTRLRDASRALGSPAAKEDDDQIGLYRFWMNRLRAEPYRRWANGFTCLCFTLIGTPVAMFWRHADVLTNFFVCFLPILAIYYPLLMFSDDLATSGVYPPFFFWLGNAALAVPAVLLLRWIIRH